MVPIDCLIEMAQWVTEVLEQAVALVGCSELGGTAQQPIAVVNFTSSAVNKFQIHGRLDLQSSSHVVKRKSTDSWLAKRHE